MGQDVEGMEWQYGREKAYSVHTFSHVNISQSHAVTCLSYEIFNDIFITHFLESVLVITYQTRTTQTPTYLASLIHPYTPSRTLHSSDQLLLTVPHISLICQSFLC